MTTNRIQWLVVIRLDNKSLWTEGPFQTRAEAKRFIDSEVSETASVKLVKTTKTSDYREEGIVVYLRKAASAIARG